MVPLLKGKHYRTLKALYAHPVRGTIHWKDIESLMSALGADISERAGSRVAIVLYGEVRIFHSPHPSPNTDKGAVKSIRKWLEVNEITP